MRHSTQHVIACIDAYRGDALQHSLEHDASLQGSRLISAHELEYEQHDDAFIFLSAAVGQHDYIVASLTQYWYRCMSAAEFEVLSDFNHFHNDTYGAIVPNRTCAKKYFNAHSEGSHIVEFRTPVPGYLYRELRKHGDVEAEDGGTFGLGSAGTGEGAAGAAFNKLLARRKITWALVNLRISNSLA